MFIGVIKKDKYHIDVQQMNSNVMPVMQKKHFSIIIDRKPFAIIMIA